MEAIPSSEEQDRQNNFMQEKARKFLDLCEAAGIDEDFVAYVMIATGYRLTLARNPSDPRDSFASLVISG